MDDGLTVFCPFSRAWCVGPFFAALGASDVPFRRATFIGYVDAIGQDIEGLVRQCAERLQFRSVIVCTSGLIGAVDGVGAVRRRRRHSLMRQLSQGLATGDRELLLLEDDTLIPPNTYTLLAETFSKCDWAIGAEVGRWGQTRPPGVWRIETRGGKPTRKEAVLPSGPPVERIDGSGFYCVLTTTGLYREMDFTTWSDSLSLDTHTTWKLTQAGCRLMVDWRVACVHLTEQGPLTMDQAQRYSRPLDPKEAPMQAVTLAAELEVVRQLSQRRR